MSTIRTPTGEFTSDDTTINDIELARRVRSIDPVADAKACENDLHWFKRRKNKNKNFRLRAGLGEGIGDMVLIKRLKSGGFERVAAPIQPLMGDEEINQFSKALTDEHFERMFNHFSGVTEEL